LTITSTRCLYASPSPHRLNETPNH